MSPVEAEASNVAGTPASTWWWPTAFATGGFTFGGGCVENRTTTGAPTKLPGSLSSFALTAKVVACDVLDAKGLWSTSRTSPPRLLTLQSNVRPPGFGARGNAATNEARSTRSVHTNQIARVVLWPVGPSGGTLRRRGGGVESIVKTAALASVAVLPAASATSILTRTSPASSIGRVHGKLPAPVGTTRPLEITYGKPSAPPSSEYERVTVRVASSGSVVAHRMSWTLPPVPSSPPPGARRSPAGAH